MGSSQELPEIDMSAMPVYKKFSNVAQYGEADWNNVVGIARDISHCQAFRIADSNPEITFFFYTKGHQMSLRTKDGDYRIFKHGDAVFFSGEPWFGSAKGLADSYIKQNSCP